MKQDSQNLEDFLLEHLDQINASQLFLIPTLRSSFRLLASLDIRPPILLGVHNVKYWFLRRQRIPLHQALDFADAIHLMRCRLRDRDRDRGRFLQRVRAVNFCNESLDAFFLEQVPTASRFTVTHLPSSFHVPENCPRHPPPIRESDRPVVFTIPGTIAEGRKDHLAILEAFLEVKPSLSQSVEVVLLGKFHCSKAYRDRILQICATSDSRLSFRHFLEDPRSDEGQLISDQLFFDVIRETDVLVTAQRANSKKRFLGYLETFGATTSSASGIADVIRFARPGILHSTHEIYPGLEPAVEFYDEENSLVGAIRRMADPIHLAIRRDYLSSVIREHSRDQVLDRFLTQIEPVLSAG